MKYKALLENNDIFIDFIEAIFNVNYICEESLEYKKCFKNIVTKDYLIELLENGNNYRQITCITGKSLYTLKKEFKKFNIDYEKYLENRIVKRSKTNNKSRFYNKLKKEYLIELLEEGYSYKDICYITGKSLNSIKNNMKKYNLNYDAFVDKRIKNKI